MSCRIWWLLVLVPASACASGGIQRDHHLLTEPGAGAELVCIRESTMHGTFATVPVFLDGKKLLSLATGEYAVLSVHPGTYTVAGGRMDRMSGPEGTQVWTPAVIPEVTLSPRETTYLLFRSIGFVQGFGGPVVHSCEIQALSAEAAQVFLEEYRRLPERRPGSTDQDERLARWEAARSRR